MTSPEEKGIFSAENGYALWRGLLAENAMDELYTMHGLTDRMR
jgi:hypothetical protein